MTIYQTSALVGAPIDVVWGVLSDVERMPEWTSTMRSVRLLEGGRLGRGSRARVHQPWLPPATWTVELFDPPRYFSWRSRTGLLETLGGHLLEERGEATLATLTLSQSGPGAAVVGALLNPLLRRYVDRELAGLAARSEQLENR
jgi:uncharacterized membrane protein